MIQCDNLKTGVEKHGCHEIVLNRMIFVSIYPRGLECVSKSIPACIMQEVCEYRPDGQKPENGQRVYHSG